MTREYYEYLGKKKAIELHNEIATRIETLDKQAWQFFWTMVAFWTLWGAGVVCFILLLIGVL